MSRHPSLLPGALSLLASVLASSPALAGEEGRRYALLVGVQEYEHARQFKPLEFAENDAKETASELKKAGYSVALLTSGDERNPPTLANINKQLDAILKKATKRDLVLVGLAGHGLQFDRKEGSHFCPSDARAHDPRTLLSIAEVYRKLEESPVGVGLLLVDACRDDGSPRGTRRGLDGGRVPNPPRGVAVLFSCSPDQYAWESPRYRHGVFFHFVLEGLRGKAKDEDGEVTWASLSTYVSKQVARSVPVVIGGGAKQEPHEVKNITGPSPVLLRSTAASEAEALYRLGEACSYGLGKRIDLKEAVRHYRAAVGKGHPLASARLGLLHAGGEGVARDRDRAEEMCRKARGGVEAAAGRGEVDAEYLLGVMCIEGLTVQKDPAEGVRRLRKAAEAGHAAARNHLGVCHGSGTGVEKDWGEAVGWHRKAAEQGLPVAQHNLGWCYRHGLGVKKDERRAATWFRKAAEAGLAAAQTQLGYCYQGGAGVERDEAEAARWYRLAAEGGDALGQNQMGVCYQKGSGVERDEAEAARWFRRAAGQGHATAQANLARCYQRGTGVNKDDGRAARWYRAAAEQGVAFAQNEYGWYCKEGLGVRRDYREAMRWFRKAADQGNAAAQNNLGILYDDGLGVRQNYAEARRWYLRAAAQNQAWAEYNLGSLYQQGRGVEVDLGEARRWYRKAAAQGHEEARKALGELGGPPGQRGFRGRTLPGGRLPG